MPLLFTFINFHFVFAFTKQEEDELVDASCVLRSFDEETYESSEDDEDDE